MPIDEIENKLMSNSFSTQNSEQRFQLLVATLTLLTAVGFLPNLAAAQSLTVTVFKEGNPLKGATVCVGSKQEKSLFGKSNTDESGKINFKDLPNGKMLVTVNEATAGAELVFVQNVSHQDLFLRIPNEANAIRCPND